MIFSNDTSPDAERVLVARLRELSPTQRWAAIVEAWATGRSVALSGLRARFPGASPAELDFEFARILFGNEVASRVVAARTRRTSGRPSP